MKFRDLTKDDIDVRVQSVYSNGLILLLYKNARVDMNILDETVGADRWARNHELINGVLYCNVGISFKREDYTEWVWKQDCGVESNTDKEKGQASDSFKRACFNWGIGRELYTSPFTWIKAEDCKIYDTGKKDKNGNTIYGCKDKFIVEKIVIEDKKIKAISIINSTQGKRVFIWQEQPNVKE